MFLPTPFPGWAPQLLTGNAEVDSEHRLLLNAIARLRDACAALERQADGGADAHIDSEEFVDLLGDLLAFLVDHFFAEEKLMKACGLTVKEKALCERHMEDHAVISDTVLRIVTTLDTQQTAALVRQLHAVLQEWIEHHIEIHDALLVRLIGQG